MFVFTPWISCPSWTHPVSSSSSFDFTSLVFSIYTTDTLYNPQNRPSSCYFFKVFHLNSPPPPTLSESLICFPSKIISTVFILIFTSYLYFFCVSPISYISSLGTGTIYIYFTHYSICGNKDQPKWEQTKAIQNLQGSQPPSFEFWQRLKGDQKNVKRRRLQVWPDRRLFAKEAVGELTRNEVLYEMG